MTERGFFMSLKYANPLKVILYFIMTTIKASQAIFIAYTLNLFITYAQNPQGSLLKLSIFAVIGLIIFSGLNIVYQYVYASLVAEVNIKIKNMATTYIVRTQKNEDKINSSFMTNDLKQLETNKIEAELEIIDNTIQFWAAIITGLVASWLLSLIFIIASFAPALVQGIFGKKIESASDKWQQENSKYTNTVNETISISNVAKLYNTQSSIISRLLSAVKEMETALKITNWTKGIANEVIVSIAFICGIIIPFSFGVYFVSLGQITLGTFMMITQLSNNFVNPVIGIFENINSIKTTSTIWKKLEDISTITYNNPDEQNQEIPNFNQLRLDNIGVELNSQPIFDGVNLTVAAGQKVLLEAPSGWGKSTLLNVLIGNYKTSSGTYNIDQQNINGDWDKAHQYFSFIQQKPLILDDTLKYNVTLGRGTSDKELAKVAEETGLTELVNEKGWDYQVGKDGTNLSGGQNQRIEIARALISNRPILLADEATSALDKDLAHKIHQTILQKYSGTVIEVAHYVAPEEQKIFDQVIQLDQE